VCERESEEKKKSKIPVEVKERDPSHTGDWNNFEDRFYQLWREVPVY
jgi:hypothetical protein